MVDAGPGGAGTLNRYGCVSAPQANVYHASTATGQSRAIKIYKTSILLFKDRDKYVSGEFRWGRTGGVGQDGWGGTGWVTGCHRPLHQQG